MDSATDKQAFLDLIRDNRKIIFKICNSYCPNKIERDDLAQEIVYHLWKSFAHFDPEMKFSTWMYRVALNVAISFYRKEKKSKTQVEFSESLVVFEENPDANSEAEHNLQLLMKFINELREIDKSIMLLYLDEKTYKEIAEITGITESNVATKVNRIKEKLKSNFSTVQNNYYGTK
jgi:RNA polymerase sigma-70 factor (ECF subfamily)